MAAHHGSGSTITPDNRDQYAVQQAEDGLNGQTLLPAGEGRAVTAVLERPEHDTGKNAHDAELDVQVAQSYPDQEAESSPGTTVLANSGGGAAALMPVAETGSSDSVSATIPAQTSHRVVFGASEGDGVAVAEPQAMLTPTTVGRGNRRDRSSARVNVNSLSALGPGQRSAVGPSTHDPRPDGTSGGMPSAFATSCASQGEVVCGPRTAGQLSDCSIAMLTQFRDNRLIVYQRGRSCKAHPFKDTGSRDGFVTLSWRAVVQAAHNLRIGWNAKEALLQFQQLLPELQPGVDLTEHDVFCGGVRSMGREPPTRRRGASAGESAHIAASGEAIRTDQGPKAPLSRTPDASGLSDLQALLVGLAKPDSIRIGGVPVIRVGLCSVESLGVPSCGSWEGSLVQPGTADGPGAFKPLSEVAAAAGLSQATVDAAEAPTWGAEADADALASQDSAFVRVAHRAWPTAVAIGPAAKRTRGVMLYGPSWPKIHWRVREACWTKASRGSDSIAVIPFTIAAMNHTGQPSHRPPVSWLSIAAVCTLGPPVSEPAVPATLPREPALAPAASSSSSSSAVSAASGSPAGAIPSTAKDRALSRPFVSAVSQPFALVSCNDKPRKVESRNNRRLAFMPKFEGPEGTGSSNLAGRLQSLTKAFISTVIKHRQPPAMELASVQSALSVILPRKTLNQTALHGSGGPGTAADFDGESSLRTGARKRGRGRGRGRGTSISMARASTARRPRALPVQVRGTSDHGAFQPETRPAPSAGVETAANFQTPRGAYALSGRSLGTVVGAAAMGMGPQGAGGHAGVSSASKRSRPASMQHGHSSGLHRSHTMSSVSASSGLSSDFNVEEAFLRAAPGGFRRMGSESSSGNQPPGAASFAMVPQGVTAASEAESTSQALSAHWLQQYGMPMQGIPQLTPEQQIALSGPAMMHQWALPLDMAAAASAASLAFSSSESSSAPSSALLAAGGFAGLAPDWSHYRQGPSFAQSLGAPRSAAPGAVMSGTGNHSVHLYELQYARETMAGRLQPQLLHGSHTGVEHRRLAPYQAMAPLGWPGAEAASASAPLPSTSPFQHHQAALGHASFHASAAASVGLSGARSYQPQPQPQPATSTGVHPARAAAQAQAAGLRSGPASVNSQPILLAMRGAAPASRGKPGADGTTSTAGASEDGAGSGSVVSLSAPEAAGLASGAAGAGRGGPGRAGSTGGMSLPSSHAGAGRALASAAPQASTSGPLERMPAAQAWSESNHGGGAGSAAMSWGSAPAVQYPPGLLRDAALAIASRRTLPGTMPFQGGTPFQAGMAFQGGMDIGMLAASQHLAAHTFPSLMQEQQLLMQHQPHQAQQQQQASPAAGGHAEGAAASITQPHRDPSEVELTRATSSRLQRRRW